MGKFKGVFGPDLAMLDPVIKSIMVCEICSRGEARLYEIAHAQTGMHLVYKSRPYVHAQRIEEP